MLASIKLILSEARLGRIFCSCGTGRPNALWRLGACTGEVYLCISVILGIDVNTYAIFFSIILYIVLLEENDEKKKIS